MTLFAKGVLSSVTAARLPDEARNWLPFVTDDSLVNVASKELEFVNGITTVWPAPAVLPALLAFLVVTTGFSTPSNWILTLALPLAATLSLLSLQEYNDPHTKADRTSALQLIFVCVCKIIFFNCF
ncbi:hypothetical protein D3C81_1326440 [compost metagenome]